MNVILVLFFAVDTVAAISEKQKILQQQREEIEELERNSDREVSRSETLGYHFCPGDVT